MHKTFNKNRNDLSRRKFFASTGAALAIAGGLRGQSTGTKPPELQYRLDPSWAPVPANADPTWEMNGVTTNVEGSLVYATRRHDPPILKIDGKSGKILKEFGTGLLVWPHGIYVDKAGFVWIADTTVGDPPSLGLQPNLESAIKAGRGHQVMKLTPDGKVVLTLGTKGVAGDGPDKFNAPTDVVVAQNGDIFVSDGHNAQTNARVVKFSKDGKFIKAWGKLGKGPGEFNTPHAIAINSQGHVLVADRGNKRIQVFDQDGGFIDQWTQYGSPSGIAIAPDDTMFVTSLTKVVIIGNAKTGSLLGMIDDVDAEGIAADGHGNVFAAEVFRRTLKKFTRQGV